MPQKKAVKSRKTQHAAGPLVKVSLKTGDVWLLGTAHVSRQSVEDVQDSIDSLKPDTVCIELCRPRFDALNDPDRWRKLDLSKVIKEKKLGLLASQLILSSFQKKIGEKTGVRPGEEMIKAYETAQKKNLHLLLADREVRTTLLRAWRQVGFFSKMWIASVLFSSLLVREDIDPEEIEKLKKEDILADLFSSLPPRYRHIRDVIIDERDRFMAEKIQAEASAGRGKKRKILAVVGAGHLAGIEKYLKEGKRFSLDELNEIPPANRLRQFIGWFFLSAVLLVLGYYISIGGQSAAKDAALAWILGRSIGAGIGAVIARAHPFTVLVTVLMAPVSIFILGSRLWMFSALSELWLKKPRVEDFENIAADTDTAKGFFRGLYNNRVLHIFWIISMVSTGLTIGNLHFLRTIIQGLIEKIAMQPFLSVFCIA